MASRSIRTRDLPPALTDEIVRSELLTRLDGRWRTPVTTVIAGAGFGKSTLIAQARRLQSVSPAGHEVYHRCDAGDETAERLASTIVRLIEPDRHVSREPIEDVIEAIGELTPIPVCLILDDVHELPDDSSGARLVDDLIARLPEHAHVVLVGRRLPAIRLAQLQAADRVVHLDAADLAFTAGELREIADRRGRAPASVEDLGGWPALVRLTLTAPIGAPRRYLWDEVLSALDPDVRDAMPCLALIGDVDGAGISALTGTSIDPERIAMTVPLVDLADDGVVRCHQLWRDVVHRLWDRPRVDAARRAVVDLLLARGEVVRAGSVAASGRDLELIRRPAAALVGATIGAFPADTGARWLRSLGCEHGCDDPAVELLRVATLQARDPHDRAVREVLDRLLSRPSLPQEIVMPALAIGGLAAHAIADRDWLGALVDRARAIAEEHDDAIMRLVLAGISAAAAELDGDIARGLADIESLGLGHALGDTVARFYVHLLVLAGRADEAIPVADMIADGAPRIGASRYPAFARWCAGDPSGVLDQPSDLEPEPGTNDRFRFAHFLRDAAICASLGRRDRLDHAIAEVRRAGYRSPKDLAQIVMAESVADISRGEERAAVERFDRHLAVHGPDDLASTVHVRRYPAVGFALRPDDDELWDVEQFGPTLRRQLEVGRLLVELRSADVIGGGNDLPSTDLLVTSLPLAWSTELLARAYAYGTSAAVERFAELSAITGGEAHAVLAEHVAAGRLPGAAGGLLEAVPRPGSSVLRIDLVAGCRASLDGAPVEIPELRRSRVRQLLALLLVEGSVPRDRVMDLMWPDRDRPTAARNLRVTLSYVRRAIERVHGDASALVEDGDQLAVRRGGRVESDVWDLQRAADDLAAARRHHDALATEDALQRIVGVDARDPLPDLAELPDLRSHAEWCRATVLDGVLSLGERRLTQGRAAEALTSANVARGLSAWSERAGRLAIAAQLLCGDAANAAVEAERLATVLDDLGAEPDEQTRLLLARARRDLAGTAQ